MKKILLIEDEAQHILLVKIRLEILGYEVAAAQTGADGLKAAAGSRPDLILLDLMLPDMEPGALLKNLRALPGAGKVPIIAFSALDDLEIRRRRLGGNIADLIQKPYETSELINKIEKFLGKTGAKP